MAAKKHTTEVLPLFALLEPSVRRCLDCPTVLTGHNKAVRCRSCSGRHSYIQRHGHPPAMRIGLCEICGKKCVDYASNHTFGKHDVILCSPACRAKWTGIHNSISRGGDGITRTKTEKDALDYIKHAVPRRKNASNYYETNRERILEDKRKKNLELKRETIDAYGGKCQCCGEIHLEFLTIDHIDGSGAEHRRQLGKGRKIYADLKRRGFPQDRYRCLCFNCNITLGFYGYCPHQPEVQRAIDHRPHNPGRRRTVA